MVSPSELVLNYEALMVAADDMSWNQMAYLRVPLDKVQSNFQRFGLLGQQVYFHKGYFRYSLPAWLSQSTTTRIAILRMDGDMWESTMDQLYNLWNSISMNGYVIIDDYYIKVCQDAVHEFLDRHKINVDIITIDPLSAYFQKVSAETIDVTWYLNFNRSRANTDRLL